MIDTVFFRAPLSHDPDEGGPFFGGRFLRTTWNAADPDPDHRESIECETIRGRSWEGSFDSRCLVSSCELPGGRPGLSIRVSPAKWLQGHNIFGSDNLAGLLVLVLDRVCRAARVIPTADDRAAWIAGEIDLTRVDVTYSAVMQSLAQVGQAMHALDETATVKFRGRASMSVAGQTLQWGKAGSNWSLVLYSKGIELRQRGHKLPHTLTETPLLDYASRCLRQEVRLMPKELEARSLRKVSEWTQDTPQQEHANKLDRVMESKSLDLGEAVLAELSRPQKLAYAAWRQGLRLREVYSMPTLYRHRAALLKHGIDIFTKAPPLPKEGPRLVLDISPVYGRAQVPEFARGTSLYVEPDAA